MCFCRKRATAQNNIISATNAQLYSGIGAKPPPPEFPGAGDLSPSDAAVTGLAAGAAVACAGAAFAAGAGDLSASDAAVTGPAAGTAVACAGAAFAAGAGALSASDAAVAPGSCIGLKSMSWSSCEKV